MVEEISMTSETDKDLVDKEIIKIHKHMSLMAERYAKYTTLVQQRSSFFKHTFIQFFTNVNEEAFRGLSIKQVAIIPTKTSWGADAHIVAGVNGFRVRRSMGYKSHSESLDFSQICDIFITHYTQVETWLKANASTRNYNTFVKIANEFKEHYKVEWLDVINKQGQFKIDRDVRALAVMDLKLYDFKVRHIVTRYNLKEGNTYICYCDDIKKSFKNYRSYGSNDMEGCIYYSANSFTKNFATRELFQETMDVMDGATNDINTMFKNIDTWFNDLRTKWAIYSTIKRVVI